MPDLAALEARNVKALLARERTYEREVQKVLKGALDKMRTQMSVLYEKYATDGLLTKADMTRYNRLATAERQLIATLNPSIRANLATIKRLRPEQYEASFFRHAWAIDQASGVSIAWGVLNKDVLLENIANEFLKISTERYGVEARLRVRAALNEGLSQGKSYQDMARDLKGALDTTYNNAIRIIRTEGQTAANAGQEDAYTWAQSKGVEMDMVWDATLDGRTRPEHGAADGQVRDEDGMFTVGGEKGPYPAWEGFTAGQRINCFPGDTLVDSSLVQRCYRRWYSGPVVVIETAGGHKLTATPNHPILTEQGWVTADALQVETNVISMSMGQITGSANPYEQSSPAMIAEVFEFLAVVSGNERVRDMQMNFHGDGGQSEVEVVSFDRELVDGMDPRIFKKGGKLGFTGTDILTGQLSAFGSVAQFLRSTFNASNGGMSGIRQATALIGSGGSHSSEHGSAPVAPLEAMLGKPPAQAVTGDTQMSGDVLHRGSGHMGLERIVNIKRQEFSGHVYNLQTRDGYYIARTGGNGNSGIVVHNCRCRLRAQIKGYAPQLRRTRDQGIIPYQTYAAWSAGR